MFCENVSNSGCSGPNDLGVPVFLSIGTKILMDKIFTHESRETNENPPLWSLMPISLTV
jgi:hypothetical protein